GGTLMFGGLFLIYAALTFFTLDGLEFMNIFTDGARDHGKYPFSIYGKPVLTLLTFVIPLACFQYWPLTWILGMNENLLCALAPTLSILFLIPSWLLWKLGLRHYKSTGS
ncbi:MAG: ABC-2 family transporter protein, partial [Oscillospiraceae bacterium]|nr:ABC-2 family transporter protein [Oscillospiraceae bacterium]